MESIREMSNQTIKIFHSTKRKMFGGQKKCQWNSNEEEVKHINVYNVKYKKKT